LGGPAFDDGELTMGTQKIKPAEKKNAEVEKKTAQKTRGRTLTGIPGAVAVWKKERWNVHAGDFRRPAAPSS